MSDKTSFRIASFADELSRTTSYVYDSNGRVTEATYPEGNKVKLTYDARGNVTEQRLVSKTPGTPPISWPPPASMHPAPMSARVISPTRPPTRAVTSPTIVMTMPRMAVCERDAARPFRGRGAPADALQLYAYTGPAGLSADGNIGLSDRRHLFRERRTSRKRPSPMKPPDLRPVSVTAGDGSGSLSATTAITL